MFENNCNILIYSPGQGGGGGGADNALGSIFYFPHEFFVNLVICCKFLPLNDFFTQSVQKETQTLHNI